MTQWKIGDRVQPKGRPRLAGAIISIDNGGRCGGAFIRFDRPPSTTTSARYSMVSIEAAGEMMAESCRLTASS